MRNVLHLARFVACRVFAVRRNSGGGRKPIIEMLDRRVMLTAPVLDSFAFHHQIGHSLVATFQDRVDNLSNPLHNTDLTLQKVPLDTNIPASSISLTNPAGTVGTFTFTNQTGTSGPTILPDGNYRAVIARQTVADGLDTMTTDGIEDFFVFAGDPNHDRTVNLDDFNIIANNFNTTGRTFAEGNLDYDAEGNVNLDDFNIMAARFGTDVPPPPPGPNVLEVGANTNFSFGLLWLDPIVSPAQEQGWRVQYSFTGQSNDWITVQPDLPANSMGWTTDAFGDGTRVWFRTRAYGNGQDTAYTPKRYAITHLPVPTVTAVTALSSTQIEIEFTDNSQNEDYFQVYRSLNPTSGFLPIGTPILSGSPTTFIDSGLNPNTQYYYYVRARNAVIDSCPSNTGNATTHSAGPPPEAPNTLTATAVTLNRIDLDWADNLEPGVTYNVYRSTTEGALGDQPGPGQLLQSGITPSAYADTTASAGVRYYYSITAENGGGESVAAEEASTVTAFNVQPSNLSVDSGDSSSIDIFWDDNSGNETGYTIYRSLDPGSIGTPIITTPPDEVFFTDDGLAAETNYYYRVLANHQGETSGPELGPVGTSTRAADENYSLIIGFLGNKQKAKRSAGIVDIALRLRLMSFGGVRYQVRLYPSSGWRRGVDANGNGPAYDRWQQAIGDGVRELAVYGYSHGGGAAYDLTKNIADDPNTGQGAFLQVQYTGYIDAIKPGPLNLSVDAEDRRPLEAIHHQNYYRHQGLHGAPSSGNSDNTLLSSIQGFPGAVFVAGLSHTNIDDQEFIKSGIINRIRDRLTLP